MLLTILFSFIFLLLGCFVLNGVRALRLHECSPGSQGTAPLPYVTVIVAVGAVQPETAVALESLAKQDYPCYELLLVTETTDEPAAAAVRAVLHNKRQFPLRCRHICSGPAAACGQKNHSLLAGTAAASARSKIFVFCDSTHTAGPDWLRLLTSPIAAGTADVTSGYHRAVPQKATLAALGRCITVLVLYLGQLISATAQPWGGNMAIRRQSFDAWRVREVWETTVVDDVTLARLLKLRGSGVKIITGAELASPLSADSFSGWTDWLIRQLLYLKSIFPLTWTAAGCAACLLAAGLAWPVIGSLQWAAGSEQGATVLALLPCLVLFPGTCLALRRLHPQPCPALRWIAACYATVFVVCWCYGSSMFARTIDWAGRSYSVGPQGVVIKINKIQ